MSSPLANLRKFAGAKPKGESLRRAAVEQCELCSIRVPPQHRHLLEMTTQKIVCACDACALRFQDVVEGRFKLIPRDARALPDFAMADADWENFALPINLAFFFYSTPRKKMMAYYPSPAGATESLLPLDAWEALVGQNARTCKNCNRTLKRYWSIVRGRREIISSRRSISVTSLSGRSGCIGAVSPADRKSGTKSKVSFRT